MMHGRGKSDSAIVAVKPANKAEQSAAEPVEPRAEAKGKAGQHSTCRAQSRESVSQGLERIRKVAKEKKTERFTSLLHHISIDLLGEAFGELKQDAAPGVDGLTCAAYEADFEHNLEDLHSRVHREPIGQCRHGGSTYPSRMVGNARWQSPPWRTRSSNGRWQPCCMRSTRKTSSGSRTGSGPGAARMMRWMRSLSGSPAGR